MPRGIYAREGKRKLKRAKLPFDIPLAPLLPAPSGGQRPSNVDLMGLVLAQQRTIAKLVDLLEMKM